MAATKMKFTPSTGYPSFEQQDLTELISDRIDIATKDLVNGGEVFKFGSTEQPNYSIAVASKTECCFGDGVPLGKFDPHFSISSFASTVLLADYANHNVVAANPACGLGLAQVAQDYKADGTNLSNDYQITYCYEHDAAAISTMKLAQFFSGNKRGWVAPMYVGITLAIKYFANERQQPLILGAVPSDYMPGPVINSNQHQCIWRSKAEIELVIDSQAQTLSWVNAASILSLVESQQSLISISDKLQLCSSDIYKVASVKQSYSCQQAQLQFENLQLHAQQLCLSSQNISLKANKIIQQQKNTELIVAELKLRARLLALKSSSITLSGNRINFTAAVIIMQAKNLVIGNGGCSLGAGTIKFNTKLMQLNAPLITISA